MSSINPIRNTGHSGPVQGKAIPQGASQSKDTATKISRVVQMPEMGKADQKKRVMTPLKEVKQFAKEIQTNWHALEVGELADKIIRLEDMVAMMKGKSTGVKTAQRIAEHVHFQFVYPAVTEFEKTRDISSMPPSFLQTMKKIAEEIAETNSSKPFFDGLNEIQQREVMRYGRLQ